MTKWHSGHVGFVLLPWRLRLCRRNESFFEPPWNFAPHPLNVHVATPAVDVSAETDGEGAGAGGLMVKVGGKVVVGRGGLSNRILGAMFGEDFRSLPGGRKEDSTPGVR